jgi:EmrB/QacA subfamily drug resistance transporter
MDQNLTREGDSGAGVSKNAVMLIAAMSSFITPFTFSSVNIALPSIGRDLALNAVVLGWVATAYNLAAAALLVPLGRLADIRGRKRVYLVGMMFDAAASILCGLSPSGMWLLAFRALQGMGGAMIFGTGIAILTSVFPVQERGRALGINVAAVYAGLSLGPLIGGFFTERLGWQSIFYLNAFLGLVVIVTVIWKLKGEWAGARGEKFDLTGSVIYCLTLGAIIYGFSELPDLMGAWLILAGAAGAASFVLWEIRQEHPVLDISFFRQNIVFRYSNLAALVNYSATASVAFLLSLYLQYIKGFSPEHAGLILVAQPVVMVICSPIAGSLSDRIEPRLVASAGMAMTTAGLAMLVFLNASSGLAFVLVILVILGLGFGLFSSPNTNAVMSSVERKSYGVASGMLGTMRLTGQMFSLAISLLLFAVYIGRVQITPQYYPSFLTSMKTAFIISAGLCFAGIFASIARGRTRTENDPTGRSPD